MGKSVFTILFLVVAFFVVSKLQTFVSNNKPNKSPTGVYKQSQNHVPIAQDESEEIMPATSTSITSIHEATTTAEEDIERQLDTLDIQEPVFQ